MISSAALLSPACFYYLLLSLVHLFSQFSSLSHSTRLLAATTLRNVLGTRNLAEILAERESISKVMQDSLDEATDEWGVKVGQREEYMEEIKL